MKLISTFAFLIAFCLTTPVFAATQVDINSADAKTLAQSLQGVGLVKAEAIVAYRTAHGPFASLDDLSKVEGIGPRIIEENRGAIVFGKPRSTDAPRATSPSPKANSNNW